MQNVQEVFNRIKKTQKEQKEVRAMYRDALSGSEAYGRVVEELTALKEKKKRIEESIKDDFRSELCRLDELKSHIESDKTLLSDAALSEFIKGETLKIIDEYDNKYEPVFSVRFKKI